jgi:hypothetical protein
VQIVHKIVAGLKTPLPLVAESDRKCFLLAVAYLQTKGSQVVLHTQIQRLLNHVGTGSLVRKIFNDVLSTEMEE